MYESADALAALLPFTGNDVAKAQEMLEAVAPHVANAALYGFEQSFKSAATEAGLTPLLTHHISQIASNYRKAVCGDAAQGPQG